MNKYNSYKDSGVEWIGEIPSHWESSKFKYVSSLYTGNSLNDEQKSLYESENPDDIPYVSSKDIDVNYRTVNYDNGIRIPKNNNPLKVSSKGSFLLCIEGGSSGRKMVFLDKDVCFVNKLCSFYSKENTKFQYYLIQSSQFQDKFKLSLTGLIGGVSISTLRDFELPLPPLHEQEQIVSFLDTKTSLIDSLIKKTKKKIKLLKEQRTSLINEVVTKGLDPNVEMKDSGVEWIGEIPSHWGKLKLNYISQKIGDGLHSTPSYVDSSEYYFINGNNLIDGEIKFFESTKCVSEEEFQKHYIELDENSLLLSINGTIGNLSFYSGEKVILGKSSCYINLIFGNNREFIYYVLLSDSIRKYFTFELTGTTIFNLSLNSVRKTPIPFPPKEEQQEIVEFLDKKTNLIDSTISIEEKRIETLKEYRQSLISEVVTGKIKVTD